MKLDPAIAALRSDRAPQRRAQAAMVAACDAWRADTAVAQALHELAQFGTGAPLEACPRLERIFTEQGEAEHLAGHLSGHFVRALAERPLGHPPLRHGFDGRSSTLLLARAGRAQLLLQAREPGSYEYPHVSFSDALRYEAVLAGEGSATIVRRCEPAGPDAQLWEEPLALGPGARLALDCASEALLIESTTRRFVCLRLHRTAQDPQPTTEHDRPTGKLRHQSCGDLDISRQDMMIALLGRMNRGEAAPLLAEIALESGDASLRWQALRECLALDTAAGFRTLAALARRADDPLAADAGALRAQLIETYPQLRELEVRQCRA